jgi:CHAD domain-containing protein
VRLQHALPGLASHSGKSRHRARQVARQLQDEARLLLEVANARRVRARAAALARLQEALGRQNDWTCARRLARTLECPDLGALEDWLRARQRHALATACRAANRYRRLPRYSS